MFSVLDSSSFARVTNIRSRKRTAPKKETTNAFVQKPIKVQNIVGTRYRSKTGCIPCRRRKKKCDETYPTCKSCSSRSVPCEWNSSQSGENILPAAQKSLITLQDVFFSLIPNTEKFVSDLFPLTCSPICSPHLVSPAAYSINEEVSEEKKLEIKLQATMDFQRIVKEYPTDYISLFLGPDGVFYFLFYESRAAKQLSISGNETNYFLRTFISYSMNEECSMFALAAWGCYFYRYVDKSANHIPLLNKAIQGFCKKYTNSVTLAKDDYIFIMTFSLILVGLYICLGDVYQWRVIYQYCTRLIKEYGGIKKLYNDYNHSVDVLFLLSNVLYHDILSSSSFQNGTEFAVEDYRSIFIDNTDPVLSFYGIDTLQGTLQPLYFIYGDILNARVKILRMKKDIDLLVDLIPPSEKDEFLELQYKNMKLQNYIQKVSHFLHTKIETCQINPVHRQWLIDREMDEELCIHEQLFELYRHVMRINWFLYIKEVPPIAPDLQNELYRTLNLIDILSDTLMIVVMCFPLLITGLISCKSYDRELMSLRFEKAFDHSPVHNVRKAWMTMQDSWEMNPTGEVIVDWGEICRQKGWELCIC